jgi:hypothetical protein
LKSDPFTFIVNGHALETTLGEAIFISPIVFECLRVNPLNLSFTIASSAISSDDFRSFLEFACRSTSFALPRARALSFLSICNLLGNEPLSLALLSSMKSEGRAIAALGIDEPAEKGKGICEATIDACASQLYSYSADDLRFVDHETLHRLLSSAYVKIESEDWLLRVLLDLGVDQFDFFRYIEVSFLSSAGLSLFVDEMRFDDLSEAIWAKVVSRLKGISPPSLDSGRYVGWFQSVILQTIPSSLQDLGFHSWDLIYRGSRDGFTASAFHGKCDGRAKTVTIIESTGGFIFGGFTPVAWDSSGAYKSDDSGKSFLFTVKNPRGAEFRKFSLKDSSKAIYCVSAYGPLFGNNCDIAVFDRCNAGTSSFTNLGLAYVNDTGLDGQKVFTGERTFTVKEIEVFAIET